MLGNGRAAETCEYIFTLFGLITQPLVWLGLDIPLVGLGFSSSQRQFSNGCKSHRMSNDATLCRLGWSGTCT
jgi:hypothetical protein